MAHGPRGASCRLACGFLWRLCRPRLAFWWTGFERSTRSLERFAKAEIHHAATASATTSTTNATSHVRNISLTSSSMIGLLWLLRGGHKGHPNWGRSPLPCTVAVNTVEL